MRSPADMRIIEIDITNACIHRCSNCTRFCGHHRKPYFMNFETFKLAVKSLAGWEGTIGIMGGEPTIHPEFERFVTYLKEHPFYPRRNNHLLAPVKDVMDAVGQMEQDNSYIKKTQTSETWNIKGFGLLSSVGEKYMDYYELIQDTFNFQALNDHLAPMLHSPIMIRRKDLRIPDEKWYPMRDNCWMQMRWSASITPKGAFFCEVAGALDMLLDGPGGWPIEPGWWKRKPEEFGEQMQWCELCGMALDLFSRDANDETDDITGWYEEALSKIGSPKYKAGHVNVVRTNELGEIEKESVKGVGEIRQNNYADNYYARFSNDWLNPKGFCGVLIVTKDTDQNRLKRCLEVNAQRIDKIFLGITKIEDSDRFMNFSDEYENLEIVLSEGGTWGSCINRIIKRIPKRFFAVVMNEDTELSANGMSLLKRFVLNPGCILINAVDDDYEQLGKKISFIFSPDAMALKKGVFPKIRKMEVENSFPELWEENKRLLLRPNSFSNYIYHIENGVRYALYGTGVNARDYFKKFNDGQVKFICSSDPEKYGREFEGRRVLSPVELMEHQDEFDKIFIASRSFIRIKTDLMNLGIKEDNIVTSMRVVGTVKK